MNTAISPDFASHIEKVSAVISDRTRFYIGGEWVAPSSDETIAVEDPTTEAILAHVPSAAAADVDAAVSAARRALETWSLTTPSERADCLSRLRTALAARRDRVATIVAAEVGSPFKLATGIQAGLPLTVLDGFIELLGDFRFEETIGNSLILREPVGVVAAITPWNYPLHQIVAKVAGALAAGCTIVVKPSQVAPLTAYELADAAEEAQLPAGVFNLISGTGRKAGEALVGHPGVDMVSFTGSTQASVRINALAAETVKKVSLELGGKSPNVILTDADLLRAVKVGVANAFMNTGQTCTAWTRMLVHESQYEEAVEIARESAEGYVWGDPLSEGTRLGPLVSKDQQTQVLDYIKTGLAEGAVLATGSPEPPATPEHGHFVAPAVFRDVTADMRIAQEEIFGPVLAMLRYSDEEEALAIANNSRYGLAGVVWCNDEKRALAFARKMKTGQVDINGAPFNPLAPFGGYKQSGNGRELGRYGLEEFLETKAVQQ
jgi:aldehyde dehydrogenase (NAD+)